MNRITLASLRVFTEVALGPSLTQAGVRLGRSQPALSRQIADLEAELGVALFARNGRHLELTAQGADLLPRAQALIDHAEALARRAQELSTGANKVLRVGTMAVSLDSFFPRLALEYRKRHPDVALRVTEADGPQLETMLEAGELDLAFSRDVSNDSLQVKRLFPMTLVALLPPGHPYNARDSLELKDLAREPLLLTPPGTGGRVLLTRACHAEGISLRDIRVESSTYKGMAALVQGGMGIAVLLSTVASVRPAAKAVPVLHRGSPMKIWFAAAWHRRDRSNPTVREFVATAHRLLNRQG